MHIKNKVFWFFFVPLLVEVTLLISLSPFIIELLATPANQVFTGINRWSTDYYIYLSYVEQGVRGFLSTKLIFTTQSHPSVFFYLAYTIPGYIFGHIFGLNSIFIYHFFRTIYGFVFLYSTIIFFYKISQSKAITLIAFFFTFYVSGFVNFQGIRYLVWLQEQNIIDRATGPLHYNIGFIIFISTFIYYFYSKNSSLKKTFIMGVFLNGLILSNPFNFLLMILSFTAYLSIKFIFYKKKGQFSNEFKVVLGAFIVSIPLFFILNYYLSIPPWGVVGVSPKFYAKTTPPVNLLEAALSVGPIFFLGIFGAIGLFNKKNRFNSSSTLIFLIVWPIIQFVLLLFGDSFKIHPPRAFSGLYYLPLAYFSASFIIFMSKKINTSMYRYIVAFLILFLFIIAFPNYYLSYKEHLFAFTDFKYFSPFIYPSKKQVEAFKFLEKNTPAYSGVLALYEASSLINGFSGNSTEVNLDQNIKTAFYSNKLSNDDAKEFLKKYHFKYVYFGYQEKYAGGNMSKYQFLKINFNNKEVQIYKVL
ncbi:MAG: hypothetical protein ACD_12C00272G0005 [uncultured bacterium]|nr:MAG: hypothetical protein ACD_12C00272G0005 [uncultured bacterium]